MSDNVILFYTDWHKRDTDFKSIGNYGLVSDEIHEDMCNIIKDRHVTHLVSTGDKYDKGYSKIHAGYSHYEQEREFYELVSGNSYLTIGNHFYLERDSNPELYFIQPHSEHPTKEHFPKNKKALLKVVPYIIVGCVQISFLHYSKTDKEYVSKRQPGIKLHIGVYHDDTIVPYSVRQKIGVRTHVTSEYLNKVFNGVDMAIVGHVHEKIGLVYMNYRGKLIPMYIPGSIMPTSTKDSEIHSFIELPMITCNDDNYSIEMIKLDTHIEKLIFYKKEADKTVPKLLDNSGLDLSEEAQGLEIFRKNLNVSLGLEEFLRSRGLSSKHIEYVRRSQISRLDIYQILILLMKKEE